MHFRAYKYLYARLIITTNCAFYLNIGNIYIRLSIYSHTHLDQFLQSSLLLIAYVDLNQIVLFNTQYDLFVLIAKISVPFVELYFFIKK